MGEGWHDFKDISKLHAGIVVLYVEKGDDGWRVDVCGTASYKSKKSYPTREKAKEVAARMALYQLGAAESMIAMADLLQANEGEPSDG